MKHGEKQWIYDCIFGQTNKKRQLTSNCLIQYLESTSTHNCPLKNRWKTRPGKSDSHALASQTS